MVTHPPWVSPTAAPTGMVRPWWTASATVPEIRPQKSPEHPEQERREKRRVHESEHELQDVHDVVERRGEVRRAHAGEDAEHRGPPPHRQVVGIRAVLLDMALIEVIGEDRVERGHIAGHSAHE